MPQPNVARLQQAGLIDPSRLTQQERDLLETLTTEEVDSLISVKAKLGYTGTLQDCGDGETPPVVGGMF